MADKKSSQRPDSGVNAGWSALGTLLGGVGAWGAIGYGLDWWLDIPRHLGLLVGMMIGIVGALYLVMKRFG